MEPLEKTKKTRPLVGLYDGRVGIMKSGFWRMSGDAVDLQGNFLIRIAGVGGNNIGFGVERGPGLCPAK